MYDVGGLIKGNIVYWWNTRIAHNEENEDIEEFFYWIFNSNNNSLDEPSRFFLIVVVRVVMTVFGVWLRVGTILIIFFLTMYFLVLTLPCMTYIFLPSE